MSDNRISITELGRRISYFRKKKLLTQKELGDRLDISDKTISKWEKGTVAPDITILENLSKVLGVSLNDLLIVNNEEFKVKKKKKLNYYFIIILMLISIPLFCFYYYKDKNSNKWIAHELKSLNDQYFVDGYILKNGETSKIIISNLRYQGTNFDIVDLNIEVYFGNEKIFDWYLNEKTIDFNESLGIVKDKLVLKVDNIDYELIMDNNFYIKIFYQKKNLKKFNDRINLGLI